MKTLTYSHKGIDEKTMFWGLLATLFFLAVCYIYFVTTTIHNVVAREQVETKVSELALSIGQKEFDLIGLKNDVTLGRAINLGFSEVQEKTFITTQSVGFISRTQSEM